MKHLLCLASVIAFCSACTQTAQEQFVHVKAGFFVKIHSLYTGKDLAIKDFYMGKYEVTQKEWTNVMGSNPSRIRDEYLPVDTVSWYDCIEYCNARSIKEGLTPFYNIDKDNKDPYNLNTGDSIKWTVTVDMKADGYRLPTENEWEYAASGGQRKKHTRYSGSDTIGEVAWYWKNSGDKELPDPWHWMKIESNNNRTRPVGGKIPNTLGLYDMSGNVREWCWDWYTEPENETQIYGEIQSGEFRVWKGGGCIGGEISCEITYRGSFDAGNKSHDQGFRVCRSRL